MKLWRVLPLLFFLAIGFFLWRGLSLEPQVLTSTQIGQPVPKRLLPILGHSSQKMSLRAFGHSFSLINVWASWCAACVQEQVFLMQLSRDGVLIIGLNYKDSAHDASQWLRQWGNPYQQVAVDESGSLARDMGVYGAPETLLVEPQGIIVYRHVGVLDEITWKREFLPRISHGS